MPGSFNNSNPSVDMVKMLRIILWNNGIHEILTDYHKCYSVTLPSKKYLKSSFFARKSVLKICSFRDWKEICSHRLQRSANIPTKSVHKHICVCWLICINSLKTNEYNEIMYHSALHHHGFIGKTLVTPHSLSLQSREQFGTMMSAFSALGDNVKPVRVIKEKPAPGYAWSARVPVPTSLGPI